ncbi:MAG: type II secretion system protein GspD [Hyphomicrobiales bacterium]
MKNKHKEMLKYIHTIIILFCAFIGFAQQTGNHSYFGFHEDIEQAVLRDSLLNNNVNLSVKDQPLDDFLLLLGEVSNVNIHSDPELHNKTITNNFYNVPIRNILQFLVEKYNLEIDRVDNILSFRNKEIAEIKRVKELNISYDLPSQKLSFSLYQDTLLRVINRISKLSGVNVICDSELNNKKVSVNVVNIDIKEGLELLCKANHFKLKLIGDAFYIQNDFMYTDSSEGKKSVGRMVNVYKGGINIKSNRDGTFNIDAKDVNIRDLIIRIAEEEDLSYSIGDITTGKINVKLSNSSFEHFLDYLGAGSKIWWQKKNNVYQVFEASKTDMYQSINYAFKNRSVNKITEVISKSLKESLEIIEFGDKNSIIAFGEKRDLDELVRFLKSIDTPVPVVLIEVIIAEFKKGDNVNTGVSFGLSDKPVTTSGSLLPLNMTFSSKSINNWISGLNKMDWINLGKVTPNFYLSLNAMESAGLLKISSTPRLSTLNGQEANLKIGQTEYYVEETHQIFANQTTTQTTQKRYKPVNADFSLKIKPFVSLNEDITLEIEVNQSDFTGTRVDPNAPPDQVSRSFTSLIRVKNEEMILLGGLEKKHVNRSSTGVPFLSKIPVIKWFFSNSKKEKKEEKLNVFLKPTILY